MVIQMTLRQFMELYNSPNIYNTRWVEATPEEALKLKNINKENQETYGGEHFDPSSGF